MKTMKEALDELRQDEDEGVYCLYLTGDEARTTLRALVAIEDDAHAAAARERLQRQMVRRGPRRRTEEEDRTAREQGLPPYDLPDADALLGFAATPRRRRRTQQP
ncbi:hypothetical protein [Streptomyces sp. NPDC002550]